MESIPTAIIIKQYLIVSIFAFWGGIAHAIQKVKKYGWRGWFSFIGDILVCVFFGNVFYQIGLMVDPRYAIILTSLGSFWGAKSFEFIKQWAISTVNIKV